MDEKIIQERTVSAILQEPVRIWVTVDHPNILHRIGILRKKRKFLLRPATLATVIRISREILKLTDLRGVDEGNLAAKVLENAETNIEALVNILCLSIHNRKEYPAKKLKDFLIKNLQVPQMLQLLVIVVTQIDVQSFTTTITLAKGVSLLKAGELIASGEQSAESKSTTVSG